MAEEQVISVLLRDGNLHGFVSAENKATGSVMHCISRQEVSRLLENASCNNFGIYLLLSENRVYVGQSSDLAKRLSQHCAGKTWWTRAVLFTRPMLDRTGIDFLESELISRAKACRIECDNKTDGNTIKVDMFQKSTLLQTLDDMLLLLELLGIKLFLPADKPDVYMFLKVGTKKKGAVIEYLKGRGVDTGKNPRYAVLGPQGKFWLNPRVDVLEERLVLILNDNEREELVLLDVPANSLSVEKDGFKVRSDKPYQLDWNIERETLTEIKSGVDFRPFLDKKVRYSQEKL